MMIYKEALVVPDGGLVRSFAPPALLRANRILRDEGTPIFYAQNRFEITIKRSLEDEVLAFNKRMPGVDSWVWHQFLHMWDIFNVRGANCLQYVQHLTLIYQLCMDNGYSFGDGCFDKRLGFRFSRRPFEEDRDGNYEEDSDSKSDSDSSDDDDGYEMDLEVQAEADDLEAEDSEEDDSDEDMSEGEAVDDEDVETVQGGDFDPVGVFELNRGTREWRSRRATHFFLFERMNDYGTVPYSTEEVS